MNKFILFLVACLILTGCVGINAPTTKVLSYNIENEKDSSASAWNKMPHPVNGKITTKSTREWCGPTVWALIPIPLWLPVCKSYTDVTFKNNVAVKVERSSPNSKLYACGPFMPFLGVSGTSVGYCGSAD